MKLTLLSIFLVFAIAIFAQKDIEIDAIMAKGCALPTSLEKFNEMARFRVGANELDVSDITIQTTKTGRPPDVWLPIDATGTHASTIDAMNLQIDPTSCGSFVEPINGKLPANASVLLMSSHLFDVSQWTYGRLSEPIYVIFQQKDFGIAHFKNPESGDLIARQLIISFGNAATADTVAYIPNGWNANGVSIQAGARIEFDDNGTPTYLNDGCALPIEKPTVKIIKITAKANKATSSCGSDTITLFGKTTNTKTKKWTIVSGDTGGRFLNGIDSLDEVKYITNNPSKTLTFKLEIKDVCLVSTAAQTSINIDSIYKVKNPVITTTDVCPLDTIRLTTNTLAGSYKWTSNSINAISNNTSANLASLVNTSLTPINVTLSVFARCASFDSSSTTKTINVLPLITKPIITPPFQTNICLGDTLTLQATNTNNPIWSVMDVVTGTSNLDSIKVLPSLPNTTYSVYNKPAVGCKSDTAQITIFTNTIPATKPIITIPNKTAICLGDTITLYATNTNKPTWSIGDVIIGKTNLDSIRVSPTSVSTTYSIFNDPITACKSDTNAITITTFSVSANKPVINPIPPGPICLGDTITLYATNTDNPTWNTPDLITGNTHLDSIRITPKKTDTTFSVYNNPPLQCRSDTAASIIKIDNIIEAHTPIITPLPAGTICLGDTITLFATNTINPTWNTGDLITGFLNLDSIRVSPTSLNTNYTVYNSPAQACKSEKALINVIVKEVCIPSSISFNGLNLRLLEKYPAIFLQSEKEANQKVSITTFDITEYYLRIFDRWGTLVFETHDATKNWDATNKSGEKLNAGTYYYIVSGFGIHDFENHIYKGYIQLIDNK